MEINEKAWNKFLLYSRVIMTSQKRYNTVEPIDKRRGSTKYGNPDATIYDVFNFWREEILGGSPYSEAFLNAED